jgi:porin
MPRCVTKAGAFGVGIALSTLFGGAAYAADFVTKAPPFRYSEADDFWTRP